MAGRLVDLAITKVAIVTTVAAFPAITAAECTAGADITTYLKDIDFDADASDTVEERSIQEVTKIVLPTIGSYHFSATGFQDFTTSKPSTTTGTPMGVFGTDYLSRYVVMRTGPASTVAFTTGDVVKAGLFTFDVIQTPSGKNDGFVKWMITGLQQGKYSKSVTLT